MERGGHLELRLRVAAVFAWRSSHLYFYVLYISFHFIDTIAPAIMAMAGVIAQELKL